MNQTNNADNLPSQMPALTPPKPKPKPPIKKKRRRSLLIPCLILGVVASALLLLNVIMGTYGTMLEKSDRDFQSLSSNVGTIPTETTVPMRITTLDPIRLTIPDTTPAEIQETTVPTEPTETQPPVILKKYEELYAQNSDFFGWLTISGTKIDYPVMYSPEDPELYLHSNFKKEYNYAGTPFLDGGCAPDSDNLIIYAHNMLDGSMFRSLLNYQQKDYWQRHPVITFNTLYEEQEFEVLAAFYDRVYLKTDTCFKFYQFIDAEDEAGFQYAMDNYREKSLYDTGVTAEYGDQLITLVTCAYHTENGRFVVVARKK